MKSIKIKLIVLILLLVIVSSLSTVGVGALNSFRTTDIIVNTLYDEQMDQAGNMLEIYLKEQFGLLKLNENSQLIDEAGESIADRFGYIDEFSKQTDVLATVFVKEGNDYIRVLTSIKDEQGQRVVGTVLDTEGDAYREILKGNAYVGDADILGKSYITKYSPIFDGNKNVIGIYFVGKPSDVVNNLLNQGRDSAILIVLIAIIFILVFASGMSYLIGDSIAKPIVALTAIIKKQGDLDFSVDDESHVSKYISRKDEIGIMTNALKSMEENVREFILKTSDAAKQVSSSSEGLTSLLI